MIQPPINVPIMVRVDPPSVNGGGVRRQANRAGVKIHHAGSILLIVGIVGMILSMLFLFWSSLARPSRGRFI